MHSKHKGKISQVLLAINIIPMLFFSIAIMLLCSYWFTGAMYEEVEQEMKSVACGMELLLETAYPGDYTLVGEGSYQLYKGEHDITRNYSLLDQLKAETNMEITLFYQDTRILTTICGPDNTRIVGSGAPEQVVEEVLHGNEPKFYDSALINGASYFSYYMPIHNSDGSTVGMLFVGKPSQEVNDSIQGSIYPLVIANLLAIAVTAFLLFCYTRKIVNALLHVRSFLADVATGNLVATLDPAITSRNDEFGDIGRSAVAMQTSLRTLVEQDSLTGLYNRRSANRRLKQIIEKYKTQQSPFCLAIGDIDFFKKVNDTYGHDCGDAVLKNVADTLHRHMRTCGFVARWGGEEFLLVFDRMELEQAHARLEVLLHDIRAMDNKYDDHVIKVTMTFGLTAGDTADLQQLLRLADEKLYVGKTSGRNCIIVDQG